MYRTNNPQYTTPIDQLPELEDIESSNKQMIPNPEKYDKFLRNSYSPPDQSGMNYREPPRQPRQPQPQEMYIMNDNHYREPIMYDGRGEPSCIQVSNHISNCPICIKFYNNDKTIYILAIVILAIFCLLLIKKVLNI
jgi:hypothetical protein